MDSERRLLYSGYASIAFQLLHNAYHVVSSEAGFPFSGVINSFTITLFFYPLAFLMIFMTLKNRTSKEGWIMTFLWGLVASIYVHLVSGEETFPSSILGAAILLGQIASMAFGMYASFSVDLSVAKK